MVLLLEFIPSHVQTVASLQLVIINILQTYIQAVESTDQEIEGSYQTTNDSLNHMNNEELRKCNMEDINAKVGKDKVEDIVGEYGVCMRNESCDSLIQFYEETSYVITNIHSSHVRSHG